MEDLKTIGEAIGRCNAEMKALHEKAKTAEGDKVATFTDAFDAKKTELADLKGRYERAKAVHDSLAEAEEMAKMAMAEIDRPISGGAPEREQAKGSRVGPNLKQDSDRELFDIFRGFLCDGRTHQGLSDRAKSALSFSDQGKESVVTPPPVVQRWFTERAKADPALSMSTDAVGYSTDSGSIAGVDPNFQAELLKYQVFMPNLYQYCGSVNVFNGRALFPRLDQGRAGKFGGVVVYTRKEGATVDPSTLYVTPEEVKAVSLMALAYETHENLRRQAYGREAELMVNMRNAMQDKWSEMILTGTGADDDEFEGILNSTWTEDVAREAAGKLQYADLVKLKFGIPITMRTNARFILADTAEREIQLEVDNEGRPIFAEHAGIGIRSTVIGFPYIPHDYDSPVALERGDVIFGDLRNYGFGIEQNITIARSEHAEFTRNAVAFRIVSWAAGRVFQPKAFAVLAA